VHKGKQVIQYLYILRSTYPPRFKIGIGWHLYNRTKTVDRTTKGKQSVIVAFILPFGARKLEAYLHRRYKRWHAPLKFGSGRSEYFKRGAWIIEALVIAGAVCLWQWLLVWLPVYLILLIFVR
jgi:hypothetical protein